MPRCDKCENCKVIFSKVINAPVKACVLKSNSKNRNNCKYVPKKVKKWQ